MPEKQITTIEVRTIPVLPEPIFIDKPTPPALAINDPILVVNHETALDYSQACEAYNSVGEEDADSLEEVQAEFPGISQDDACNYNIYGFTLQGWLNFEANLAELAGYVEKLRDHIDFLEDQLRSRYKIIKEREAAMTQDTESQKSSVYSN